MWFFFYKNYNLTYSLDDYEDEIIQKGNEIIEKYLEGRKFNYEKLINYNNEIIEEHLNFINTKIKGLRCFCLNEIYENPIKNKYFFKYLSYGKNI